ncbi:MAG: protein kinase domain-containing protein [Pseudomonas sp.]
MNSERWERVNAVFDAVLLQPQTERDAFVRAALVDDDDLCRQVLRMLVAHERSGPLDRLAEGLTPAQLPDPNAGPAALESRVTVGAWRLLEEIGRGGMGTVYLAERADGAFEMRAAIKLLRRDLLDAELRARLLAERRILARIEHPGIARLLDGGVTEEGRPWFAMEYVPGVAIDRWCHERGLAVRERLQLFCDVCAAVQHVHAHLVIHRDIKPSNILIDAEGRVKLLDFGIAKLLDPQAFPETDSQTRTGQFLLTPEFASPEQLRGLPVSTSSDVFQLGLLLYELLTGQRTPRVSGGTGETTGAAPSAQAPLPLRRDIDADLDTIVRAATQTDAARRYASVEQLGEDVRRWLRGLPIRARPETTRYLISRFVRRHRAGVVTAAAFLLALISFSLVTLVQSRRIARERDRARQVSALLTDVFESADPVLARGQQLTMREVVDRSEVQVRQGLDAQPALRAELLGVLSRTWSSLGDYERALALERESWALERSTLPPDHAEIGESLRRIAVLTAARGQPDTALALLDQALTIVNRRFGPRSAEAAQVSADRAYALQMKGDYIRADSLYNGAIALQRAQPGMNRDALPRSLVNHGWIAQARGDLAGAEARMREALELRRKSWPAGDPRLIANLSSLANILTRRGNARAADSLSAEQLDIARRVYTPPHPQLASALSARARARSYLGDSSAAQLFAEGLAMFDQLGVASGGEATEAANEFALHYQRRGDFARAEPLYRAALAAYTELRGAQHVSTAIGASNHAGALHSLGRAAAADSTYAQAILTLQSQLPVADARLVGPLTDHGVVLLELGRHADAEARLRRALELASALAPENDNRVIRANARLGMCLTAQKKYADAEPFLLAAHRPLIARGIKDPFALNHVRLLIGFYEAWGRPQEVRRYRALIPRT